MSVTQKVFDGLGIVREPQKNTMSGNGMEMTEAFLT